MDCSFSEELLSARRDGELTPDEAAALEKHLLNCPACRKTAQVIDEIGNLVASLERATLPEKTEKAILSETRQERSASSDIVGLYFRYYRIPRPLAWASVVVMLVLAAGTLAGPVGEMIRRGDHGRQSPAPGAQKVVLTEYDVISINGQPVQKVTLSETDVIMTRTISGHHGKS